MHVRPYPVPSVPRAAIFVVAALLLYLAAAPVGRAAPSSTQTASSNTPGAVYAMTNERLGNRILVYDRHSDGTLAAPRCSRRATTAAGS